jgi:DNA repair protein RadC
MNPTTERTRRVREAGTAAHCANADLLAAVIGGKAQYEKAQALLAHVGYDVRTLLQQTPAEWSRAEILTDREAAAVHAALELGRRTITGAVRDAVKIRSPRDVYREFAPTMEELPVEEFHVGLLDVHHRLDRRVVVTRGILDSSLVHPREVFTVAVRERAAAIILVHNHPSGDPTPSPDDRTATEQMVQSGRLLGIPVQDHVIIGRGRFVSFAEAGLL